MKDDVRLLEAVLFAATEPLDEATIAARLPEGLDVPALLAELAGLYEGHGIALGRLGGKWAFRTAEDLSDRLRVEITVGRKLSRAAVETLAIVAYHQPVTRAEVEEIRGVAVSKGTFDVLLDAGWIRPVGRRRTPGRPATWGTSQQFLEHFGLDSLSDLPGVEELKAAGLLDTRPAATVISGSPSLRLAMADASEADRDGEDGGEDEDAPDTELPEPDDIEPDDIEAEEEEAPLQSEER